MKKAFVCSAYRGNIKKNTALVKEYCSRLVLGGYLPLAPHLYFTSFLNDDIEEERNLGINLGIEWLKTCDEMFVFGKISEGMAKEIEVAEEMRIKITYVK